MRIEAARHFAAKPGRIWSVLREPAEVMSLVPGTEDVEDRGRSCVARVSIPLGVGDVRMRLRCDVVDDRHPGLARVAVTGAGVGIAMSIDAEIRLEEAEAGAGTSMRWAADFSFAGPSAAIGHRVLRPIVEQQVANVLEALDRRVSATSSESQAPAPRE